MGDVRLGSRDRLMNDGGEFSILIHAFTTGVRFFLDGPLDTLTDYG